MANDAALDSRPLADWHDLPAVARPVSRLLDFPRLPQGGAGAGKGAIALPAVTFAAGAVENAEGGDEAQPAVATPDAGAPVVSARINPTRRDLHFIVPVVDGDRYLGEVELTVTPRDELSVQSPRLLQMLQPILRPDTFRAVAEKASGGQPLSVESLQAAGIGMTYDTGRLVLAMAIPVDRRLGQSLGLRNGPGVQSETVRPAAFSAYANFRATTDIVEAGSAKGVLAPTAEMDSAVRVRGLVIENGGYLSARAQDPAYRRTGSRLVYDDVRHGLRFMAGDTFVQARRFQASPSILGLSISRRYAELDPQREVRASGEQAFSITGASTVETIVNGRSVERRRLGPGNYTLNDFPLAEGSNQVRLRIEDAAGGVRVIEFSAYANQQLLGKGLTEFALSGGVFSTPTRTGFTYSRDWTANGFVRSGVTQQVTLGANFQATSRVQQGGVEVLWGAPLGLIGFNLAASTTRGKGTGLAAALTFERLLAHTGTSTTSLRAAVETRSRRFEIPNVMFGPTRGELHASAGVVRTFGRDRYMSLDARYDRYATSGERTWSLQAGGGIPLNQRFTALGEAGVRRGGALRESYVRVGLRVRFGDRGLAETSASSRGEVSAMMATGGGNGNGAWNADANFTRRSDGGTFTATGTVDTNRATLGVQQAISWSAGGAQKDARTTLRAGFSLATADGALAMGRPVGEAFVIVKPHRTLGRVPIYVDPQLGSEIARSGASGPALDGALAAYTYRTLVYQAPAAPAGYDLGTGTIALRAPWRAGYKVVVGSDYHIMVIGKLLDRNGLPVKLLAGQAQDLDNPGHPAVLVLTSRDGRFGAQGLRAGRWRITMPTQPPETFDFTVSERPDGIFRAGEMHPVSIKEKSQ